MSNSQSRDIVVIGASAGGLDAIRAIVSRLPADFPAALFIAQHVAAIGEGYLPDLLKPHTPLPIEYPNHGQPIVPGHIYVAPADTHLTLRYGAMSVARGPKENGHRPSVDALFRSAARAYGPRVIGVVLSGYLDCGSAGLLSIKARAGVSIAQDPKQAAVPDMPRNAIELGVDHIASVEQIPALLQRLVSEAAPTWPANRNGLSAHF